MNTETTRKDVAPFCQDLVALLAHAKRKDQRLTGLKLLDAWMGKGSPALRLTTTRAHRLARDECERVIVELLLRGCLKEDFHFTPYTTISYLMPGWYLLLTASSVITNSYFVSHSYAMPVMPCLQIPLATSCSLARLGNRSYLLPVVDWEGEDNERLNSRFHFINYKI